MSKRIKLEENTHLIPDADNSPESDFILIGPSCWIVVGGLQLYIRKYHENNPSGPGVIVECYALGDAMGYCYGNLDVIESEIDDGQDDES